MSNVTASRAERRERSSADLYRAVWRWHFYAGLFVLPFLVSLAVTGGLYLFRDEIDAIVHSDLKRVEIQENVGQASPSGMVWAALGAYPGTAIRYVDPPRPDAAAEVVIDAFGQGRLVVGVNPYDGTVLGALPDRGTVMGIVRDLHSLRYFGPIARGVIEIAAGWAILLVATGLFLWWPRGGQPGRRGGVVTVRGTPKARVFWRDVHAVSGLVLGGVIVFLAVTGMPWSQVWGGQVNQWANGSNFGYPSGVRVDVPMSGQRLAEDQPTSWSLEQAEIPVSGAGRTPIGLDAAVETAERLGLHPGFAVRLPQDAGGVFSASVYPDDVSLQRVVHLDQYTGEPLVDMSYGDYGFGGRALEWGINVHLGQEYGRANQLLLAFACLGIVVLSVSAGVMWWKRRPARSLGVPPMPRDPRVFRGLLALLAIGGVIFPLVGASLIVMLAIDIGVRRLGQGWRMRPAV